MEEQRKHDEEILVAVTKLNSHFEEPNGIVPIIRKKVEETNGNVKKNTSFRLRAEGVIGSVKFIGFSNVVMIIALLVGGFLISTGFFDKNLTQSDIKSIGDYITDNYDLE